MRDKIFTYLKSQKTGVTSNELVEQVLKIKGASPVISEKLIRTVIGGDRRFVIDEKRFWRIIERNGTPLSESEFILLCLQTAERADKLRTFVEISAEKIRDDKTLSQFHTLINPGLSAIPIINLPSDISQEIKQCGVSIEKAAHALLSFIGDAVLVGYDIHSSVNQLNRILNRSHESIENPSLCLKLLARKLIPDFIPKSLDDVAAFFKLLTINPRHTETEVRTIAEIFSRYKELLKEKGPCTVEEILEFQYPDADRVDFGKYAFDRGFLWAIPEKPGIYKMKNKDGEIIYVGKAKNLKARVSSYFWNTSDRHQKIADLLNTLYSIEYEETGSELSAMLQEYRLIQQYRPVLNQQLEVHERPASYGNLKNFIVILPASMEGCLDLLFVKEGLPLQHHEILKNAVNFSGVERILDTMYYKTGETIGNSPNLPYLYGSNTEGEEGEKIFSENIQSHTTRTNIEMGETEIVLSWIDANKDSINYINMDTVGDKEACLKIIRDYTRDNETSLKKHFRS